jgi:hypothetical protein
MARQKNPAAVSLGRLGGKARARSLSPQERSESARKAAIARARALTSAERKRIAMLGVKARLAKQLKQRKDNV